MENQKKSLWERLHASTFVDTVAILGVFELFKNTFKKHGDMLTKSGISWLGVTAETFYASACSYAFMYLGVTINQICEIERVVMEHPESRARFVSIIGRNEEKVELPDGSALYKNIQGANALLLMSKMNREELIVHLEAIGVNNTLSNNTKKVLNHLQDEFQGLKNNKELGTVISKILSKIDDNKKAFHDFLDKPTWLERLMDKIDFLHLRRAMGE